MFAKTTLSLGALATALLLGACMDSTSPIPTSSRAVPAGARMSGGGGGGGGGGVQIIPQVAGVWTGSQTFLPAITGAVAITVQASLTINEDAAGNLTGIDNMRRIPFTGKASTNGTISLVDVGGYGSRRTNLTITGSVACSDGSTATVLGGTFQQKEGGGPIAVNSCPGA
ncbi:MAG TPA: hypothetical protein VN706_04805 [Gemmatimonadaceae bacterium]|nr:hypothetical protein [Gemmatimonadaceae bacterium]